MSVVFWFTLSGALDGVGRSGGSGRNWRTLEPLESPRRVDDLFEDPIKTLRAVIEREREAEQQEEQDDE